MEHVKLKTIVSDDIFEPICIYNGHFEIISLDFWFVRCRPISSDCFAFNSASCPLWYTLNTASVVRAVSWQQAILFATARTEKKKFTTKLS